MNQQMTPTPHIAAKNGEFAPIVLMPGDPLRAKFIAEQYLEDVVCVNEVRGMLGYTGRYHGTPVSVMGSGMGMPSMGIYAYELFHFYGVESIIRVGSAGGLHPEVAVHDVVLGMAASTNSNFAAQYRLAGTVAPIADFLLLRQAVEVAEQQGLSVKVGNLLSSDVFYDADHGEPSVKQAWRDMGILAVEMESAALYLTAMAAGKKALCICTISDHLFTEESLSSEDRQTSFSDMMTLGLEVAACQG